MTTLYKKTAKIKGKMWIESSYFIFYYFML